MMYIVLGIILFTRNLLRADGLIFVETPPTDLILPEDSELSLTCRTDPDGALIGWYYKQTEHGPEYLLFEAKRLVYQNVQISYEGYYFCKATLDDDVVIRSNDTKLRIAYINTQFLKVPSQVYTIEGSTVEFQCSPPDSYPPANVTWQKNEQTISTSRCYMLDDYTLVIVGILPEDSGDYQCLAYNVITNETRTSLEGELYVTQRTENDVEDNSQAPEPSIASYFAAVDEGEAFSLLCGFQGLPYPTYRWYFDNGTEIPEEDYRFSYQYENQVLLITDATRDMAGTFQCEGTNTAGSSVINVTLFVDYTEDLGFTEDLPEVLIFQYQHGSTVDVECKGAGSPPLTVGWYTASGVLISETSILTINTSQSQNITVNCRVENRDGRVSQFTRIIVKEEVNNEKNETETIDNGVVEATVECYADRMELSLSTDSDVSLFHLLDQSCEFPGNSSSISAPLEMCGTRIYYNESHIIYKNQVTGESSVDGNGVISRGEDIAIAFECSYRRAGSTANIEWEAWGQVNVEVKGVGAFTFLLDMYDSYNFTDKIDSSQYPVRVGVQDNIYLEVSIVSPDNNLSLTISDIIASDSPSGEGGSFVYSIVNDGCIVDSTFQYIQSNDFRVKRFTLKAFHFLNSQSVVYLHAFVKICNTTEDDSCTKLCAINKRSAGTSETAQYHIFQGPFISSDRMKLISGATSHDARSQLLLHLASLILVFYR